MPNAQETAALNRAVCTELGLHFWKRSEVAQGADVYWCQVVGHEAIVIVADDGWWRCWPESQEPADNHWSHMGFGPTNLERLLARPKKANA